MCELRGFWSGTEGEAELRGFWCGTEGFSCRTEGFMVLNGEIFGDEKVWSLCGTDVLN